MGKLAGSLLGSVGGFFGSYWVWLLVIAGAFIAGGALGYERATSIAEDKLVAAQMEMYAKGAAAQKKFSDGQFALATADFNKRHAADLVREAALKAALANVPTLVPRVDACVVSPEAMKALNEVAR